MYVPSRNARRKNMNSHVPEWKKIKGIYEESLCDFLHINYDGIKYRIECIDELIKSAEKEQKELNHFK